MRLLKFAFLTIFLLVFSSYAKDKLDIKMEAYLITFEKKGENFEVVKKPLPKSVKPDDIVEYVIKVSNPTDKTFKDVFVKAPIPKGTEFIENSNTEGALFSIDGGKTYNKPPIKYKVKEKDGKVVEKVATPDMYTNIGWIIKEIKPHENKKFFYWVRVKK